MSEAPGEPAATTSPGPRRPLPVALALLALVAGVAAVALAGASDDPGSSPAQAVDATLAAVADGDAIGVVASLAPEERDAIGPALPEAVAQLQRLGLLDEVDLTDVDGVVVSLDAPRYAVHQLDEDTAAVDVVAGRLTAAGGDGLPLTGRADTDLRSTFGIDVLGEATRDFAQDPLRLVAVRRDGTWHTSLGATLLDAVLADPGARPGAPTAAPGGTGAPGDADVAPTGADDPAGAVQALLDGWASGDLGAALAVLDPVEAALAYEWSSALLARAPATEAEVERFAVDVTGEGATRAVTVTDLAVAIQGPIDRQDLTAGDGCFRVDRRFAEGAEPWITFEACAGDPPTPHPDDVVNAERVARGGEPLPTDPAGLDPDLDLDAGVRLGPEAVDQGILERQAAAPRRRPHTDPLSALAHFGGGAELPTFVVVERDGRWFVQPTTTVVRSVLDALVATDPADADVLVARVEEAFRSDEPSRVVLESRDPDNVLFGSATAATSPLVATCFRTVLSLSGDVGLVEHGTACVRQLEADGRLDGQPVPALLGAAECLMVGPTTPPSADVAVRRFYLVAVARRACVADRVATGALPAASLDEIPDPVDVACWAAYLPLAADDPEAAWAAADVEVRACGGLGDG